MKTYLAILTIGLSSVVSCSLCRILFDIANINKHCSLDISVNDDVVPNTLSSYLVGEAKKSVSSLVSMEMSFH